MNDHQVFGALAVLLVIVMALVIAMRAHRRVDALERHYAELSGAIEELRSALASAGESLAELLGREAARDRRIEGLAEQQETLRLREDSPARSDEAIRLARGGASAEAIVQACGLNRGEAELVVSLHGRQAPEAAEGSGLGGEQS